MSERSLRVDELLREEISRILTRDVDDPRIGFLTVTRVEVTPDLRNGTVWASVIGQPAERRRALRALQGAMPFIRGRLGSLRLRRIPELIVRADETATHGTRVLELLRDLESGTEPSPTPPAETLPTPVVLRGRSLPPRPSRSRPARPSRTR